MTRHAYPLSGVKVLDLSRVLAGPVCTQLLADLGADVVKVERPGLGDDTRQWGPPFLDDGGTSAYYLSANRGKRSLALDLAHPAAAEVLAALIRQADVLIENFLPDAVAKFGLDPHRLQQLNPRLVSCSISGFGRTGPLANQPGYDLVTQACAGLMSITGEPDGQPMKVGVAISDILTGLYAAVSVLAGLRGRDQHHRGWAFDLSLADCTLASLVNVAQSTLLTGQRPQRWGNAHPQIVPYESFETADGHLVVAIGNDRQWRDFCHEVAHAEWAIDARFATNPARVEHRDELIPLLQALFRTRDSQSWEHLLAAIDVPHGRVLSLDEIVAQPQTIARQMVQPVTDEHGRQYPLLGSAVHWHDQPPRAATAPPDLGQHTDEVLRQWLDYHQSTIDQLRRAKAIA